MDKISGRYGTLQGVLNTLQSNTRNGLRVRHHLSTDASIHSADVTLRYTGTSQTCSISSFQSSSLQPKQCGRIQVCLRSDLQYGSNCLFSHIHQYASLSGISDSLTAAWDGIPFYYTRSFRQQQNFYDDFPSRCNYTNISHSAGSFPYILFNVCWRSAHITLIE